MGVPNNYAKTIRQSSNIIKVLCEKNCPGDNLCAQLQTRSEEHQAEAPVIQESSEERLREQGSYESMTKSMAEVCVRVFCPGNRQHFKPEFTL